MSVSEELPLLSPVSPFLVALSRLPVPVPRILQPAVCPWVRFVSGDAKNIGNFSLCMQISSVPPIVMASTVQVHRIGVMFAANSCCASGVNNVLSGLYSYLRESGKMFSLVGIQGGPLGLLAQNVTPISSLEQCSKGNNLGGIEILGYSSFKAVEDAVGRVVEEGHTSGGVSLEMEPVPWTSRLSLACASIGLTGLVVVAASDELAATVELSRALFSEQKINVAIVPQSRNQHVLLEDRGAAVRVQLTSLGFDSARRVLAELAGNIAVDCITSKKYWHFINCGDAALVAEVGLLIRANVIVTEGLEEVGEQFRQTHNESDLGERFSPPTMAAWIDRVAALIVSRSENEGIRSGVVMVSQCAFTRTPEMNRLRAEIFALDQIPLPEHIARKKLSPQSLAFLDLLPKSVRSNLLRKRDPIDGLPLLSYWSPEEFLVNAVREKVNKETVAFRSHFLAHESRCPVPTAFDCVLGSSLGRSAGAFLLQGIHGHLVALGNVHRESIDEWIPVGVSVVDGGSQITLQKGYTLPLAVRSAMEAVMPAWARCSRYRSFGPYQVAEQLKMHAISIDAKFLPLNVLAARWAEGTDGVNRLVQHLDQTANPSSIKVPPHFRTLKLNNSPLIKLPLRDCSDMSPLEQQRTIYQPRLGIDLEKFCVRDSLNVFACNSDWPKLKTYFPHTHSTLPVELVPLIDGGQQNLRPEASVPSLGIVFLCSQVPGCHTVVAGVFDRLKSMCQSTSSCKPKLMGFLGGAPGLVHNWSQELTPELIDTYRNQGGVDLLGHFGENLNTMDEMDKAVTTLMDLSLDGLIIVGSLQGQLTGALLNERLRNNGAKCCIVTVPASAENDIPFIRQSIGFDTVSRVFASTIGNLFTESQSSRNRWYFVRLLSHHVSHLAIEVALATHPNIVLVTEEIALRKQSLEDVIKMITDCIWARYLKNKRFGIVLVPDGVAAAIPEIRRLLRELDAITMRSLASTTARMNILMRLELVQAQLSKFSVEIFKQLPRFVQEHLIGPDMRHVETGKIDIANVPMERILKALVEKEIEKRLSDAKNILEIHVHSLGYQGRSGLPSNTDCDLAYTCGQIATHLVSNRKTGLLVHASWDAKFSGIPLPSLVHSTGEGTLLIEPTQLLMQGQSCVTLRDSLPRPALREGRQLGPYCLGDSGSIAREEINNCFSIGQGNSLTWSLQTEIDAKCLAILEKAPRCNPSTISALAASLRSIMETVERNTSNAANFSNAHSFMNQPDDILSTCAPSFQLEDLLTKT